MAREKQHVAKANRASNQCFVGRILYDYRNRECCVENIDEKSIWVKTKNIGKITWNMGKKHEEQIVYEDKKYSIDDIGKQLFFKFGDCDLSKQDLMGDKIYAKYLSQIELDTRHRARLEIIKKYEPDNPMIPLKKQYIIDEYYFKELALKEEDDFRNSNINGDYFARLDLDTLFYDHDRYFTGHYYTKVYISNNPSGQQIYLDIDTIVWQIAAGLYSENQGGTIHLGGLFSSQISRNYYYDTGVVIDWRAPVADLYYDNQKSNLTIGQSYKYDHNLMLKRRFENEKYSDIFITGDDLFNEGTIDPFLMDIINANKNKHKLCDIIKTIQSNQNNIIRYPLDRSIVVQGCAGSGKTMIMLHRLSYIKYNNSTLDLDTIKILTPNELFNIHINELSQTLELERIERLTVEKYYSQLLSRFGSTWAHSEDIPSENFVDQYLVNYIYSDEFGIHFENVYNKWSESLCAKIDAIKRFNVKYNLAINIIEHGSDHIKVKAYKKSVSLIKQKLQQTIKNQKDIKKLQKISTNDRQLSGETEIETDIKLLLKLVGESSALGETNVFKAIYQKIIEQKNLYQYEVDLKKRYRFDMYAMLMFCLKYYGKSMKGDKFLFADEGQDISKNEYKLLKKANGDDVTFNVFGDMNQLIKEGRGISDWSTIASEYQMETFTLNENYRNTTQITEYCNEQLGHDALSIGVSGKMVGQVSKQQIIPEFDLRKEDNNRIAIIAKDVANSDFMKLMTDNTRDANLALGALAHHAITVLSVEAAKGLEFDVVYALPDGMSKNEQYIAFTRALSELIIVR